ncbi:MULTISPECIES: CAP domain-containing protein [unclassified Treponema]|uniref:CAP domain-containing protein n=1 Tax=unclassified Treponema TaxID=2638727 RepID=UPI0025D085DB|nr:MULTISPECIES: CAP domain-containing protein [unclassified Treponema]
MKKQFLFVLFTIFISAFLFCQSSAPKKTKPANSVSTSRKNSNASGKKRNQQKAQTNAKNKQNSSKTANSKSKSKNSLWNIKSLDTARNVDYLDDFEKNVILEMNKARTNPKQYADLYIVPRLENFDGYNYVEKKMSAAGPYNRTTRTTEGPAAVKECINYMYNQSPRAPLLPSKALTCAARDHAETQVVTDQLGHKGVDGSTPFERIGKYGIFMATAENIFYCVDTARNTVVKFLIDDGVDSRGHRKNIMNRKYNLAGVGYAECKENRRDECVIDFAQSYTENE